MQLTKNVCINGTWYGPAHGNAEMSDDEWSALQTAAAGGVTAEIQFRDRLMAAVGRMIDTEVIAELGELSTEERAELFALSEDDMVAKMLGGEVLVDRASSAPAPAEPAPLEDDDEIVVAENRYIRRGDLVAILDLFEETGAGPDDDTAPPPGSEQTTSDSPLTVPEGSVDDLLAWVHGGDAGSPATDGWRERAVAALEVEKAGESPRKTLIEPLERELAATTEG